MIKGNKILINSLIKDIIRLNKLKYEILLIKIKNKEYINY